MQLGESTVAVVTGSASGIGLALADAFAEAGCSLVLADVEDAALADTVSRFEQQGVAVLGVRTDVSNVDSVEALAAATLDRFGAVHVVCNNAGVVGGGDPWFGSANVWDWVVGVNLWGVVHGVRAFLPHVLASGGGHIVNTASIAGLYPGFSAPYDASKHAVVALTEGLFHTVRAANLPVGVSCVCPGWVRTSLMDSQRNWPDDLGPPPERSAVGEVVGKHVRRAIAEGMQPAAVASLVLDAIRANRFWVFPHPDFVEIAVQRFHRIEEGLDPIAADQMPGMPPQWQIVAEVMTALQGDTT